MMMNAMQRSARVARTTLRHASSGMVRALSTETSSSLSTNNAGEFTQVKKVEGKDRLILFGECLCRLLAHLPDCLLASDQTNRPTVLCAWEVPVACMYCY
jgi:hypothetical protein